MKRTNCTIVIIVFLSISGFAQIGGNATYKLLSLPSNAYSAAMGGNLVSVHSNDLNLVLDNPAWLDSTMHNHVGLSYINYFTDINFGYVAYARKFNKIGTLGWGLQFLDYGTFTETDATGLELGEFTAGEYALVTSYSRPVLIDSLFKVGANLKVVYSALEQYQSSGLALDVGAGYLSKNKRFSIGLVIKNAGHQLTVYNKGNAEPLPFEIQLGLSKRVAHAPIRLTLLAKQLQKWNLSYHDPEVNPVEYDPVTGDSIEKLITFDKFMRHLNAGLEFMPSPNFNIRFSYNYQRKKEMQLASRSGMTGIAFGFTIKVSKFHLSYGRASYHLAGASNHITLVTNLSEFRSKKSRPKTENINP